MTDVLSKHHRPSDQFDRMLRSHSSTMMNVDSSQVQVSGLEVAYQIGILIRSTGMIDGGTTYPRCPMIDGT